MTTKYKTAADFRKNLESRLKNITIQKGERLERLRKKVAFDRLLLAFFQLKSRIFFLKGGYAMELRIKTARATKDVDLTCLKREEDGKGLLSALIFEELKSLAEQDLGDFFSYQITNTQIDLNNAPYGSARYSVTALLDGKIFVRFQLDVGADAIVTEIEKLQVTNWLDFCGISLPVFPVISIERQFAEKLHAYTLPRLERPNTCVKDLVDMVLLAKMKSVDLQILKNSLSAVFKVRQTHSLPRQIDVPPQAWEVPYHDLAAECGLPLNMNEAFRIVEDIYSRLQTGRE